MRRLLPRSALHDESGATLVIVVLSLMGLFGMMVLVVDVGALLYARRAMVTAADSAALAAAQSCGQKEGAAEATLQAEFYAVRNQSGAELVGFPVYTPDCDAPTGTVTVRVRTEQPLFFAPVLGLAEEGAVMTEATAMWGGAGAGEKVAPLMLSAHRLSDCEIPPPEGDVTPHQCTFWWNNSPASHPEDLANAEWGTLDLLNWDVEPPVHCNNSTPPQFEDWMLNGFFEPLPITPPTTYVCRGQGNFGNALNRDIEEAARRGDPLYFPVNDPQTQIDASGTACPPPAPGESISCHVDKYNIIGFAKLKIIALYKGNTPEAATFCGPHIPNFDGDSNGRCMVALWEEYTPEGLNPEGGENFGLVPIRLVK
jgi:Putative Flp pilus-assembly TadE/G-like